MKLEVVRFNKKFYWTVAMKFQMIQLEVLFLCFHTDFEIELRSAQFRW